MGINQIYLEIYDECNFSVDELIASNTITIPDEIFKGETNEEWYTLNGKQGDGKEGQILLVFSFIVSTYMVK
jgi:toll-interacting protein